RRRGARRPGGPDAHAGPPGDPETRLTTIRSRDNPQVKRWAKLAQDSRYRRSESRALIEGPHLVAAALQYGFKPRALIATEEALRKNEIRQLASAPIIVSAKVFEVISDAETPQGVAAEIDIPPSVAKPGDHVFLEGVQDAGNVGAILRTAAAFGIATVV